MLFYRFKRWTDRRSRHKARIAVGGMEGAATLQMLLRWLRLQPLRAPTCMVDGAELKKSCRPSLRPVSVLDVRSSSFPQSVVLLVDHAHAGSLQALCDAQDNQAIRFAEGAVVVGGMPSERSWIGANRSERSA